MMYQALYRKYRPKTFDDVVGQEHITETLKKQVETGRLSHAYLFIGTRGTGKTTCAKILAKAVNCEHPVNGNPCNRCAACRGIDDGSILDVVELDAASNNGVDNVRALRDEAVFSPASVRKRVYIVEVHMLSNSAFNALLKILEEPPEHLMFILATTELHKVPATILSRCQRHSFKRIPVDTITARLNFVAQQEHLDLQPDAAALLARMADGGMRDALTLLDQCCGNECISTDAVISAIGLAGNLRTAQLLRSVAAGDTAGALEQFRELWQDGKDPSALLDELSMLQRDLLMQAVAPRGGRELLSGAYDPVTLDELSGAFSSAQLLANLQSIQQTLGAMASQPNPRIAAELCLIRLCRPELCDDVPTLCARMDKLEQTVYSGAIPAPRTSAPAPKAKPEPKPVFDDVPPWEQPAPPVSAPKAKPEPKPVHDDVPPWEQPAPPVSAPKAKPEPKPVFDDVPPWEQPAPPVSAPKAKPEPKPVHDDVPPWEPPAPPVSAPKAKPEPKPVHDDVPPWEPPETVPAPIPDLAPEPVPKSEPEPEPIPEPVSAPAPEAAPAEAGTFDWQALCAYMERELPVGIYHFLLDPLQAAGELSDGTLTLHLNKAPAYPMFNKPEIAEKFRLAVQTLTGQNVRVVMQPMDTAPQIKQRQIEELTRFPNVTIR